MGKLIILIFFLLTLGTSLSYAQYRPSISSSTFCTGKILDVFTRNSSYQTYRIYNTTSGTEVNSSVATISSASGSSLSFGVRYTGQNDVKITFTSEGSYSIACAREDRVFGYEYGIDSDNFNVSSLDLKQPSISFSSFNVNDCSVVLNVTNDQSSSGVSYSWTNACSQSGASAVYCNGQYSSSVTATCGTQSQGASASLPTAAQVNTALKTSGPTSGNCSGGQFGSVATLTASVCFPVVPSSWVWSPNTSVFNQIGSFDGSNSSSRTYILRRSGSYSIPISARNSNISNSFVSGTYFFTVIGNCFQGSGSSPTLLQTSNRDKNVNSKSIEINSKVSDNFGIDLTESQNSLTISSGIFIFPNPTNDMFTVSGLEGIDEVRLINVQGQILQMHKMAEGAAQQELKVAQYPNGLYLVQLKNTMGETRVEKVQVNH